MSEEKIDNDNWDLVIKPKSSLLEIPWRDIWRYRDLLTMFVKRDVVTFYKQTVLGPIWFVLQPVLTTIVYIVVFGNIAGLSTDGMPKLLFYLSGVVIWNYFADSLTATANTFRTHANIFGKVYFPRLIMPLSQIVSGLIKFGIQFSFFLLVYAYYIWEGSARVLPNIHLLLVPVYLLLMAGFGLGMGVLLTSMTTKYRDLSFVIGFGVQLLMYATPVIYPLSSVPEDYRLLIQANPISPIIEGFRYALLGAGSFSWGSFGYAVGAMVVMLVTGIVVFNKTEKTFIDTV